MIEDISKNLKAILYERVRSPLFGTFLVSWLVWNWRIVYLTVFISQDNLRENKIDIISNSYLDANNLLYWPLLSTIVFLTIVPFASNGAYYLHIRFKKWRLDKKHIIENKQLLTLEQSIALRGEMLSTEQKFEKLLDNKNLEIKQLEGVIEKLKSNTKTTPSDNENVSREDEDVDELYYKIVGDTENMANIKGSLHYIQNGMQLGGNIDSDFIAMLEAYDAIVPKDKGVYQLTNIGKKVIRKLNLK